MKGKLPKSFHDDGLADILEWIDEEILKPKESATAPPRKRSRREKSPIDDDEDKSDIRNDVKVIAKKKVPAPSDSKKKPIGSQRFDMYGNVLDKKGNIIEQNVATGKLDFDCDTVQVDEQLQRKVRGLINRLTSQTIAYVSSELERIYKTHQRLMINEAIFRVVDSLGIHVNNLAPRKIVAELMLLISYLSHRVGNEIGSGFVHRLIVKFDKLIKTANINDEDKSLDNILACLVNLYIINLIDVKFLFEVIQQLCFNFSEKSIELVLFVMTTVGFQLRKDDPASMKRFILFAQDKCSDLKEFSGGFRVGFMIEALAAIKNNNITKLPNYGCNLDRDTIESTMKNLIKRAHLPESLGSGTYNDVLASSKWHVLETQVYVPPENQSADMSETRTRNAILSESDKNNDAKLCKALGLNTPIRKTVFNALVKASDYIEATNFIIGFGVKTSSDAMTVCLHVAIHEKTYNPFYFHLLNNLCKFDRKYKMATKFAIQDKLHELGSMANSSKNRVAVFARLTFELIKEDAIPITVLKAVEWTDITKAHGDYLNIVLGSIMDQPNDIIERIFTKVDKKGTFASAIRMFIACFLDEEKKSKILSI